MEVCWRPLCEGDLPALLEFCLGNAAYYSFIRCTPDRENLREQLTILPPGAAPEQKRFLGRWEGDDLTAILDVILDWPRPGVAYVGWLMVAQPRQGCGIGWQTVELLAAQLKTKGYHTLRLGCVEDNLPGLAFWRRCGFTPTGERVDPGDYTVVLLEKQL